VNSKILELEKQLKNSSGTQKIDLLNDLAFKIISLDQAKARRYFKLAKKLSTTSQYQKHHYDKGLAFSLKGLALYYEKYNEYAKTSSLLYESTVLFNKLHLQDELSNIYIHLGVNHSRMGNLPECLNCYLEAIKVAHPINNIKSEANAYINMGVVYFRSGNYKEAQSCYDKSLNLFKQLNVYPGIVASHLNIANVYIELHDYNKASESSNQAFDIIKENNECEYSAFSYIVKGKIYLNTHKYEQAHECFSEAFKLADKLNFTYDKVQSLIQLSYLYQYQSDSKKEYATLQKTISIAEEINNYEAQHRCHERLAQLNESKGDYKKALKHYKLFQRIKEDFHSEQADERLKTLQVTHEAEVLKQEAELQRIKNNELAKAKEAAETANKAKSVFLANMSHELRTPMNSILGFTQLLTMYSLPAEKQKEYIRIIQESSEFLLVLINNILDLSKIEADRVSLNESDFDINYLFRTLVEMLHPKAQSKDLEFIINIDPDIPAIIHADEIKLKQILINLLSNAIKFTVKGTVSLSIKLSKSSLKFEVSDTGIGINAEDLPKLFTPFNQTTSGKLIQEGTGLGLTISKKFINIMGGEISVNSIVDKGTTIRFTLPFRAITEKNILSGNHKVPITGLFDTVDTKTILIVDDSLHNRKLLEELLKPIGFRIISADDGQNAVYQFKKYKPDCILMDIHLPTMDGNEALKIIRTYEQGRNIPIIALTASAFEEVKQNALKDGFDDFLTKPINNNELLSIISKHMGIKYRYALH
jgi:signal transduction histidine kinase/CheY-like chemotaxis protein